jgi:hypothetical protein
MGVMSRNWHGTNVQHRYLSKSLFAAGEGKEGGEAQAR